MNSPVYAWSVRNYFVLKNKYRQIVLIRDRKS
jgi:hypothetical protein